MTSRDVRIPMSEYYEKNQDDVLEILNSYIDELDFDKFVECLDQNRNNLTPKIIQKVFIYACPDPGAHRFIKVLIEEYGADVNKKNQDKTYPLDWVVDSLDIENFKALIETSNIDLNTMWYNITAISHLCLMINNDNYENCSECVKYLMSKKVNMNIDDQTHTTPMHMLIQSDLSGEKTSELLKYIFDTDKDKGEIDVNQTDKDKCSLLFYAVQNKKAEVILQLLQKHSAYIGTKNKNHEIAIKDIPPEVLEKYFDSCVKVKEIEPCNKEDMINIDLSCLVPPTARKPAVNEKGKNRMSYNGDEMVPIEYIANTRELQHLLTHPVINAFIFLKWQNIRNLFYIKFALFTGYFIILAAYIMCCYLKNSNTLFNNLIYYALAILVSFVLIRELLQCFLLSPALYFKSFPNYVELCLVGLTMTILFYHDLPESKKRIVGAISILLAGTEFTYFSRDLPYLSVSVHLVILRTVTLSFLKILSLYSIYILAFAFSFYILYNDDPEHKSDPMFDYPGSTIMMTIVMMTGEYNATDLDPSPMSYIVLVLFIFLIAIIMFNLLNGLAVSDTQAIQKRAEIIELKERTHLLSNYEQIEILTNSTFECFKYLLFKLGILERSLSLFPHSIPSHKIHFITSTKGISVPSRKCKYEKSSGQDLKVEKSELIKVNPMVIKYSMKVIAKKTREEEEFNAKKDLNEMMKDIESQISSLPEKIMEEMKPFLNPISSETAPK